MTVPMKTPPAGDIMETVLLKGDLSKLTPDETNKYYFAVCKSLGLNPLTRPFEYLTLNGKKVLYARRDCTDQLRRINNISIAIVSQDVSDGLLSIHVRAKNGDGREDEDLGVVNFPDALRGEARANTILKAVTKAKRRVTLSISGLGFLDETEVEDIPASAKRPAKPAENVMLPPHNPETGEITSPAAAPLQGDGDAAPAPTPRTDPPGKGAGADPSLVDRAKAAAKKGEAEFLKFYKPLDAAQKKQLSPHGEDLRNLMNDAADLAADAERAI